MLAHKNILCISSQDWISHWCVPQQTMSRLANHNRIIYVEPYFSIFHIIKYPRNWKNYLKRFQSLAGRVTEVQENLYVYSPPPTFLPFCGYIPLLRKLNSMINIFIFSHLLKFTMKKNNFEDHILWIYSVRVPGLIKRMDADLVIYDCIDEWSGYISRKIIRDAVKEKDRQLCKQSDLVFVGSKSLLEAKKVYSQSTFFVPHAADVVLFRKAAQPETSIPFDISTINKPIIGLVGVMDKKRIDLKLLELLAEKYEQCSLVLIGPVQEDLEIANLVERSNVFHLGSKELCELPGYLKAIDVCIIPYLINDFTLNIYPLKLHEYMASGKPIVSTKIPALEEFNELIHIASNRENFVHQVGLALKENDQKKIERRIEVALENTWEKRVGTKSRLIKERLGHF